MQKANKISAFFFLGLFSLMMLHQAFPHLHEQNEDSHSHSKVTHSGEHHHHEDNKKGSKENQNFDFGIIGFFMDMHVHATSSGDIVVSERTVIEQRSNVDKDIADNQFDFQKLLLPDIRQNDNPPIYHPPNRHFNPYLSYLDLRGPPALG